MRTDRVGGPRKHRGRLPRQAGRGPREAQEAWPQVRRWGATDSIPTGSEPKRLILYVVGDVGRPSQTCAPMIDGTLRGPDGGVRRCQLSYASTDRVLTGTLTDGALHRRLAQPCDLAKRSSVVVAALGLSSTQVLGLIDFYHAAKQLGRRGQAAPDRERDSTHPPASTARVAAASEARPARGESRHLRELCRTRSGRHDPHSRCSTSVLKHRHRFACTTMFGARAFRWAAAP